MARSVKITVLSTMLADTNGIGEWGFAALVEVDGDRLLFDTGARPETVLRGVTQLLGAHGTGLEAVYRLGALLGLDRKSAVVGAVGSSYSSKSGLAPRRLAR